MCAGASAVLDIFQNEGILENVNEVGAYLWKKLEEIRAKYPVIRDHRGKGLIQGLEFEENPAPIAQEAIRNGVILITAENNVIRFVPPLVIRKEHVDEMAAVLGRCIEAKTK